MKFINLVNISVENITHFVKKWFIYQRAYTGNISWPLVLLGRRYQLKEVSISVAQFLANGYILDVGTGPGLLPIEVAINCPKVRVVGVDIESELINDAIKQARKKGVDERISFINARAECLPFSDNSFDMVLSTMSFHLWKERQQAVNEMMRVLKPGGQAIILVGKCYLLKGLEHIFDFRTRKSHKKIEVGWI